MSVKSRSTFGQILVSDIDHPLHAFLLGNMLGDGYITKRGCLVIDQKDLAYTQWKFDFLKQNYPTVLAPTTKIAKVERVHPKTQVTTTSYRFTTRSCFENWRLEFYTESGQPNKTAIRGLSKTFLLEDLFKKPLTLAVWFMDDGGRGGNTIDGIILTPYNFTDVERQDLLNCLKNNFGLELTLHAPKTSKQLYISKSQTELFKQLVSPFIIPLFIRKLPLPRND